MVAPDFNTVTLQRLVDKKILDYGTGGFWTRSRTVSRSGACPTADGTTRAEAGARVLGVVLNDVISDPRDVILVALMHACDGFKLLLSEEDYEEKLERIEDVSRMDLVGRSVSSAVKLSSVNPKTRRVLRSKPVPKLRIADVLRQRDFRAGNIPKAMCGIYEKYGSVVKVPFKMRVEKSGQVGEFGAFAFLKPQPYMMLPKWLNHRLASGSPKG